MFMQTNFHMSVLVHEQAKKYGDREMLIYQDFGGKEWKSLSWNQVSQTVQCPVEPWCEGTGKHRYFLTEFCSVYRM